MCAIERSYPKVGVGQILKHYVEYFSRYECFSRTQKIGVFRSKGHVRNISVMFSRPSNGGRGKKNRTDEAPISKLVLTLILLNTTTPTFSNSVDPDQMASKEAI